MTDTDKLVEMALECGAFRSIKGRDWLTFEYAQLAAFRAAIIAALKARIAELEKDAGRYRYLRDTKDWPREVCDVLENIRPAQEWDNTIDAAIAAGGKDQS